MKNRYFQLTIITCLLIACLSSCKGRVDIGDTTTKAYTWTEEATDAYVLSEGAVSGDFIYSLYSDNTLEITSYEGDKTTVTVPAKISNRPVVKIGDEAFCYCSSLVSVTISSGVTEIGKGAFYACTSLTSVDIPDTVTIVGDGAFKGCSSLAGLVIPVSTATIGSSAFADCTALKKIYYKGTSEDWKAIKIGSGNETLTGAEIVFDYSTSSITETTG